MVLIGWEVGCKQSFYAELEDDDGEEDDDQAEPPGQACAEALEEGAPHVVDCGGGVVGA